MSGTERQKLVMSDVIDLLILSTDIDIKSLYQDKIGVGKKMLEKYDFF